MSELDPEQSILLDYTSDTTQASNFTNWDVIGKFPWIFGIFSGYEPNSEIRGYYEWTNKQLKIAKSDPMCKGLVLWPELSHGDTLITEYLAKNAWDMETPSIAERTDTYCTDRYPKDCVAVMQEVWRRFMPIVQLRAWSSAGEGAILLSVSVTERNSGMNRTGSWEETPRTEEITNRMLYGSSERYRGSGQMMKCSIGIYWTL